MIRPIKIDLFFQLISGQNSIFVVLEPWNTLNTPAFQEYIYFAKVAKTEVQWKQADRKKRLNMQMCRVVLKVNGNSLQVRFNMCSEAQMTVWNCRWRSEVIQSCKRSFCLRPSLLNTKRVSKQDHTNISADMDVAEWRPLVQKVTFTSTSGKNAVQSKYFSMQRIYLSPWHRKGLYLSKCYSKYQNWQRISISGHPYLSVFLWATMDRSCNFCMVVIKANNQTKWLLFVFNIINHFNYWGVGGVTAAIPSLESGYVTL